MPRPAFVVLCLLTAATGAACAADDLNLLAGANGSFDRDVSGWQAAPGDAAAAHAAEDGQPRAGALRADGGPNGSVTILGPCVAAKPGAYEVRARTKVVNGTPYYCGANLFQYSDESCERETGPVAAAAQPPGEQWREASASGVTDGDARSLQVRLVCSGRPGFVVLFDDLVVTRR